MQHSADTADSLAQRDMQHSTADSHKVAGTVAVESALAVRIDSLAVHSVDIRSLYLQLRSACSVLLSDLSYHVDLSSPVQVDDDAQVEVAAVRVHASHTLVPVKLVVSVVTML